MSDAESGLSYWTRNVKDPRDPVGKIKLSDLMNYDARATYKHKQLWEFHLGWSHADYNHTTLASVRKIRELFKERSPFGRTMSIQHINEGNRDLCAWGYMRELEKGKGPKASRFLVNWDLLTLAASGGFPPTVHLEGDASEMESTVHLEGDATVHLQGDAGGIGVHPVGDKDLSTPIGLPDPNRGIDRRECATPTAPPLASLSAATAGTAQGFEELWRIYDFKQKKKESRAAYAKLAPDAELHAIMIEAAAAWRASWAAQNNQDAPRYTLAKWIEREDYECAPPTAYRPKERKVRKPAGTTTSNDMRRKRILAIEDIGNPFDADFSVKIRLADEDGSGETEHLLHLFSENGPESGNQAYASLGNMGGSNGRAHDAIGKVVNVITLADGVLDFRALPGAATAPVAETTAKPKSRGGIYTIERAEIVTDHLSNTDLKLMMRGEDGLCRPRTICIQHRIEEEQLAGQADFQRLCRATGIGETEDPEDFIGRTVFVTADNLIRNVPINDNDKDEVAA